MKIAKREKYFVSIGACILIIFFLLQFIVLPFFEKKERLKIDIQNKEKDLKELSLLSAEYQSLKQNSQNLEKILAKREKNFNLFSFLEKSAGEAKVKDHIKYMKPSTVKDSGLFKESMVEMKLEGVTINQLLDYLFRIEEPEEIIFIKRITINDNNKEKGYLDSILQVMTFS